MQELLLSTEYMGLKRITIPSACADGIDTNAILLFAAA